ncbi:MAG TPA: hypothetical protein DCP47_08230 [Phycisphaerales bacterium]|nr:hypothetical protein [Phycisphaerales bacterium]
MKKLCLIFLLTFFTANCYADIIVDNTSSSSSRTGTWQTSTAPGYYNTGSVWARDGATFTWNFTPTQTGTHTVSMWWTQWESRSTSIPVVIKHANGTSTVYINQQSNGGKWNTLGSYTFNSGTSYYVKLTAQPAPTSTCADAIKVVYTGSGGGGGGGSTTDEKVYIALVYNSNNCTGEYTSVLKNLGATQTSDGWTYTRSGKTYRIYWANSISALRMALGVQNATVVVEGHSNYGLGFVYATNTEITNQKIYGVKYVDDDRIFQMTPKWVAIDVKDFILYQAYPNWTTKYKSGGNSILPYTFSQGTPPYNYYITYKLGSTYYKIETATRSAMQRFPDCGKTPWYSSTGAAPNPSSSSDTKYFITNSGGYTGGYAKPHYKAKTIIATKSNTLALADLKYSRLMLNSCGSGYQYGEPFRHGKVFYSMGSVYGNNGKIFLRSFLQGKTDYQIWQSLQSTQAIYDYYDFSKAPSSQLATTSASTLVSTQASSDLQTLSVAQEQRIESLENLSVPEILNELDDPNITTDEDLMTDAISISLEDKEQKAVDEAIKRIKTNELKRTDPNSYRNARNIYVARKVVNYFADVSANKLVALYKDKDPYVRGRVVTSAGELSDISSVKNMLIKALGDKSNSEDKDAEMEGWPLRVCDVSYNQLVLNENVTGVLRTIGTGLPTADRDYHINILKKKLKAK